MLEHPLDLDYKAKNGFSLAHLLQLHHHRQCCKPSPLFVFFLALYQLTRILGLCGEISSNVVILRVREKRT